MNCGKYSNLDNTYTCRGSKSSVCKEFLALQARETKAREEAQLKEPYFVGYAVRGQMACPNTCHTDRTYEHAVRYGMPNMYPMCGDVPCPSTLQCNGWADPPIPHTSTEEGTSNEDFQDRLAKSIGVGIL